MCLFIDKINVNIVECKCGCILFFICVGVGIGEWGVELCWMFRKEINVGILYLGFEENRLVGLRCWGVGGRLEKEFFFDLENVLE